MPVKRLHIEEFLKEKKSYPVLDVRSPREYVHAHLPGAKSLPLFSDDERAVIGTAYKQLGRSVAVEEGLKFFSSTMQSIRATALKIFEETGEKTDPVFYVYCWRGGMRSNAVAWLLDLYGYNVFVLEGGYKSFRKWVLAQFEKKRNLKIIGGYTGSGKTELLATLKKRGENTIDIEHLANHKGSSFGDLGMPPQPQQEMFENNLAWELGSINPIESTIWLEDESRNIGNVQIPEGLWIQMRKSDISFLEIPFAERLNFLTQHYGKFNKENLKNAVVRIQKKLGGLETKNAIQYLEKGKIKECFEILLRYYDKLYSHSLEKRLEEGGHLHKIACKSVDNMNAEFFR